MNHFRLIGITLVLATLSVPSRASGPVTITATQIAAAIGDTGLKVSAEQVTLLSDVVAKTNAPALRVASVGPWQADRAQVRLDCVVSDECLPFVVTVRRSQGNPSEGAFVASGLQASRRPPVETAKSKTLVHIGSPAVLLLDGGHVHIQLAVICLESGSAGQVIRVAARGRERTYLAEVCSDGTLRGTL